MMMMMIIIIIIMMGMDATTTTTLSCSHNCKLAPVRGADPLPPVQEAPTSLSLLLTRARGASVPRCLEQRLLVNREAPEGFGGCAVPPSMPARFLANGSCFHRKRQAGRGAAVAMTMAEASGGREEKSGRPRRRETEEGASG
jgi:hypothetical protein